MSASFLAYAGALCAAWSAMGGFCMRSAAVRDAHGWSALHRRDSVLSAGVAIASSIVSLILVLQTNVLSFGVIFWFIMLALSGIGFALLLPFFCRLCKASLIATGAIALVALASISLM